MEAYKSHCPDCGATYTWVGYKTGIGKTPAQLEAMHKEQTVCRKCGSPRLKTGLDHESDDGQAADDAYGFVAKMLVGAAKKE